MDQATQKKIATSKLLAVTNKKSPLKEKKFQNFGTMYFGKCEDTHFNTTKLYKCYMPF